MWRCFSDQREIEQAQAWPITRGIITDIKEDKIYVSRRYGSSTCYVVTISYNYQVDGKNYSAKQNRFLDRPYKADLVGRACGANYSYWYSDAKKIEQDYPKGSATAVYYDQKNPGIAYIDNKTTKGFSLFQDQALGSLLVILGLGGVLLHSAGFDQNR
jgi:hypothetical protein